MNTSELVLAGCAVLASALLAKPESVRAQSKYTRNVAIVIWDGAEILDWTGPAEVFQAAGGIGSDNGRRAFNVYTVSATRDPIVSQSFIDVIPDFDVTNAPKPDVVVFPGGGTNSVMSNPAFLEWAGVAAKGAEVALSVCTGAFILGHHGMLDGKRATTWYGAVDNLERSFPEADVQRGPRYVDNGQVVTTAGVSAGIDGAIHVVARLLGRQVANETAEYMEYKWAPESYLAQSYSELNPSTDDSGRLLQQARTQSSAGNYDAAVELCMAVLKSNEDHRGAWSIAARAYYASKQYDKAVNAFLKASSEDEERASSLYNAACSAALMNDADHAIEYLTRAIAANEINSDYARTDTDFNLVRTDPRFEQLVGNK